MNASPDKKYPGYYTLISATISSMFDNKTFREISPLIPKFQIIESIKNDSIRGSASVVDGIGLLEEWPLRGEENLTMVVDDPYGNTTTFNFHLYKVDNVTYDGNSNMAYYSIHFVSKQRYAAGLKRIIKAYEKPASDIVKDIFVEYGKREARPNDANGFAFIGQKVNDNGKNLDEFKTLVVEETEGNLRCIIPNYTPMQAFRFIADRSISRLYRSCSYRFFERSDAFYFVTDEYMMEKAVKENKIFKFTSTALPKTGAYFEKEMNNFESISSPNKVNSIDDLTDGSYKSQAIVVDILFGLANIKEGRTFYDYDSNDYYQFPEDDRTDKHTDDWIGSNLTEENCKKFLIIKDYDLKESGALPGDKSYPEIVLRRNAFLKQQENIAVSAVGHGRLDITCGDVIQLEIPPNNASQKNSLNKHLTGTYLVQEVIRSYDKDIAKNLYRLVKREWVTADDV